MEWAFFLAALRRGRRTIVCFALLGFVVAVVFARVPGTKYTSLASVAVNDPNLGSLVNSQSDLTSSQYVATQVGVMESNDIARQVARQLPPMTMLQVERAVKISQRGSSEIIDIKAVASTAAKASELANALATTYVRDEQAQVSSVLHHEQSNLQSELASIQGRITSLGGQGTAQAAVSNLETEATQLSSTLDQVELTERLASSSASVVNVAVPAPYANAHHTVEFAGAGLLGGVVIGAIASLLVAGLRPRISTTEELEDYFGTRVAVEIDRREEGEQDSEALREQVTGASVFIEAAFASSFPKTVLLTSVEKDVEVDDIADALGEVLSRAGRAVDVVRTAATVPVTRRPIEDVLLDRELVAPGARNGKALIEWTLEPDPFLSPPGSSDRGKRPGIAPSYLSAWLDRARPGSEVVIFSAPSLRDSAAAATLSNTVDVVVIVVPIPSGDERRMRATLRSAMGDSDAQVVLAAVHRRRSRIRAADPAGG